MNKILSTLLLVILLYSCKKDDNPKPSQSFTGQWKLVEQDGGIGGWSTRISADTVILLTLTNNNSFYREFNGKVISQGSYKISTQNSNFNDDSGRAITFNNSSLWQFINVKNDTLTLVDPHPDGYSLIYVKTH